MRSVARVLVFALVVALCGGFGFGVQAQSHTHSHDHNHNHQFDYSGYEVQSQRSRVHTEWGIGVGGVYTIAAAYVKTNRNNISEKTCISLFCVL